MKYRKYDTKCCTHIMSLIAKPNCALLEFEVMAERTVSRGLKRTRRKKSFREKILPLSFLLVFVLPFFLFLCLYVIRHVGKSYLRGANKLERPAARAALCPPSNPVPLHPTTVRHAAPRECSNPRHPSSGPVDLWRPAIALYSWLSRVKML